MEFVPDKVVQIFPEESRDHEGGYHVGYAFRGRDRGSFLGCYTR